MPERLKNILKIVCLGLAALMLIQLSRLVTRKDPLADLKFAAVLASATNSNTPAGMKGTNAAPPQETATNRMTSVSRPGPGTGAANLPPTVQARLERIIQSEILGPVMRPLPMALLGIAGRDAFLRAPNGQTGLVKEGDELGGVKLLRIGTNRVLIEHEGQKKELMLFSGFGSETLLPPQTKSIPQ